MAITIYQFIEETFSETELLVLCENDEKLQKAKTEFSEAMPFGEKIRRLVAYCKRHGSFAILWTKVKEERKELWIKFQMSEKEPDSAAGQVKESMRDVESIFDEIKAIENTDTKAAPSDDAANKTHPLTQGAAEVRKWFAEELNADEQVFLLTAALFSSLGKHEFMQIYDGVNQGLQEAAKVTEEEKK